MVKLVVRSYRECVLSLLRSSNRPSLMVIARNDAILLTRVNEGIIGFLFVLQLVIRSYRECILGLLRPSQRLSLVVIARNDAILLTRENEGIIGFPFVVLKHVIKSDFVVSLSIATSLLFQLFRYYIFS